MKVVFVSNYLNHHQIPFCQALIKENAFEFTFIQIEDMDQERVKMGWGVELDDYPFAISYKNHEEECKQLILNSDMVIFGGVDDETYIKPRLKMGKPVIRYSERIYKEGQWKFVSPRGLIKKYNDHVKYRNADVFLFCAGGYVASDYNLIKAYPDKMYTWGYFPKVYEYTKEELHALRNDNTKLEILWSGRMIDWKHPEYIIDVARKLKSENIPFHFTVIGNGELRGMVEQNVVTEGLMDSVSFVGFVSPTEVREYMRKADIFLFTSDFKEGWGAVLNESMNSGCAVVAGSGIGAVPFLLKHGKNGFVYKNGNVNEMLKYIVTLAKDEKLRKSIGEAAYDTMISEWTPEHAASTFVKFVLSYFNKEEFDVTSGPLSKASIISPGNGYKYVRQ